MSWFSVFNVAYNTDKYFKNIKNCRNVNKKYITESQKNKDLKKSNELINCEKKENFLLQYPNKIYLNEREGSERVFKCDNEKSSVDCNVILDNVFIIYYSKSGIYYKAKDGTVGFLKNSDKSNLQITNLNENHHLIEPEYNLNK